MKLEILPCSHNVSLVTFQVQNTQAHEGPAYNPMNELILVVDDDETICSLFKDTLEEAGYMVTTAGESSKGLELVKGQDYDLVFVNLKMPKMDGVELFRQIRVVKPSLPVTIITGYPNSDLMMRALAHGPLGVMSKPFREADILAAVNNYLLFGQAA